MRDVSSEEGMEPHRHGILLSEAPDVEPFMRSLHCSFIVTITSIPYIFIIKP